MRKIKISFPCHQMRLNKFVKQPSIKDLRALISLTLTNSRHKQHQFQDKIQIYLKTINFHIKTLQVVLKTDHTWFIHL